MKNRWLFDYRKNYTSQRGEDGVLEKIFEILEIDTGWCVDVGAYGKNLSNTYSLIAKGWSGVLIERDKGRLYKLEKLHRRAKRKAICINSHVEVEGKNSLQNILANTPLPKQFEFLSIDIDGNDYYIWGSLTDYSPKVVIIEFNSHVKLTDYIQPVDGQGGASLSKMVELGKSKGYELVCAMPFNAIFVKKELYHKFGIKNNSPEELWEPDPRDFKHIKSGTNTKIVGFQSGHDVAYCILENGVPVLHEELERISRVKMELGDGLKFFLSRQKSFDDIKYFTFGNWGGRFGKRHRVTGDKKSQEQMEQIIAKNDGEYFEYGHHLSHAANAFFTSNFEKSLIITLDGGGCEDDKLCTCFGIFEGVNNKINKALAYPEVNLGGLWYDSTKYIFGLSVRAPKGDQAGTVMAMATLGKPKYVGLFADFSKNLIKLAKIAKRSEKEKFNVAASLQEHTEVLFKNTVSKYITEHENLCVSGGVSLNCVLLGKIRSWFPNIKNIFCDPVPYDAGLALGSARYLWHHVLDNPRIQNNIQNMSPYLGIHYSKKDVQNALEKFKGKIKVSIANDDMVLAKIKDQKIVSVFGGGSESGRRALGNRSILADPRNIEMKKIINEKVKHRQWFRPVAPSILEEKVAEWFVDPNPSPYMSIALKVKKSKTKKIRAVIHFDGTARLQTVNKELSPWYHGFISKWEKISGVPVIINTSFNDSEPIVETPQDAIECFLRTNIDYVYFFDYGILLSK